MRTLYEITRELAHYLMPKYISTATGGSTSSLTDSAASFSDDQVGGTVWIGTGNLAGKALKISARTSTQLTFATQAVAAAAGNLFSVTNSDFNVELLRAVVNSVLRKYARRRTEDSTLETVAMQEVYTLPTGVSDVKEVFIAQADAEPYEWQRLMGYWREEGGSLRFPAGKAPAVDGKKLRLVYRGAHTDLTDDDDTLPLDVSPSLVFWAAAVELIRDGSKRFHDDPKRDLMNLMNEAQVRFGENARLHREWVRDPKPSEY